MMKAIFSFKTIILERVLTNGVHYLMGYEIKVCLKLFELVKQLRAENFCFDMVLLLVEISTGGRV